MADEGYVIEYSDNAVYLGVQGETPATPKPPKEKAAAVETPKTESVTRHPTPESEPPAPEAEAEAPEIEATTEASPAEAINEEIAPDAETPA